jgi:signal transduction histidine kinase
MFVLLIILWITTAILFVTDPKTESTRWLCGITFFSGLGGLVVVIRDTIIPYVKETVTHYQPLVNKLQLLQGVSASLSHYMSPYTLFVYAIVYSNMFKDKWKKYRLMIVFISFVPVLLMYILFPVYPVFAPSYPILSIWVAPYVLTANFLLIYSSLKTKGTMIKYQKILTCTIIIPATMMSLITNYLLRIIDLNDFYFYNTWIIILQFLVFIYYSYKKGALGVKLTIEKHTLDRTLKSITSGTILLNHTIKNEISKISMCMNNINHSTVKVAQNSTDFSDVNENIEIVNDSLNFLSVMINKIQSHVKDIVLEEKPDNLGSIIDNAVNMVAPIVKDKDIKIIKNYGYNLDILCDSVHLQETLRNILNNSIEAIQSKMIIRIDIYSYKKYVTVAIKDNGTGISKENLPHIIDPFFSTKHRNKNFGLGLLYCYNVMQQHGGSMEVQSEEGKGTTVLLNFPVRRILRKMLIS